MQTGFFVAGVAGQAAQQKMDNVAHNLANVDTTGFLGSHIAFRTSLTEKLALYSDKRHSPAAYASEGDAFVDTRPGNIRRTGNDLDFAITGNAWFHIQTGPNETAYTRAGNFKLGPDGNLLTQDGEAVLDPSGAPIILPQGAVKLTDQGALYVNDKKAGDIGLVKISDVSKIRRIGSARITTPARNTTPAGNDATIHQGELTGSNVNSVLSMVEMMGITRNAQGMMKLIEQYNHVSTLLSEQVGRIQG